MTTIILESCPMCDEPIRCEVEHGEGMDVPEECDECGHVFTEAQLHKLRMDAMADAVAYETDKRMDRDR